MQETAGSAGPVRFGAFEVDLRTGEVRKQGLKIKLQEQPLQVLAMLLQHPGEVVTREELQKRLWPSDTFVDFEHGLNKAINKIREALGDSAQNPRFVETVPRRGYRFIVPEIRPIGEVAPRDAPALLISRGVARALFLAIQVGYLAMYGVALYHLARYCALAVPLTSPALSPTCRVVPPLWRGPSDLLAVSRGLRLSRLRPPVSTPVPGDCHH